MSTTIITVTKSLILTITSTIEGLFGLNFSLVEGGRAMWMTVIGLALFGFIAVPVLPLPRARSVALGVLHRASHLAVLAAVGACAVFFLAPDLAPGWLNSLVQPLTERMGSFAPEGRAGWVWLPTAALVVALALPWLSRLDFARRLNGLTVLVRRLLGDIRDTSRELANALEEGESRCNPTVVSRVGDLKAAVESMDRLTKEESEARPRRRKLIELITQS